MSQIIAYRLTATGIWQYDYYHQNCAKIATASGIVRPDSMVRITGRSVNWHSGFNIDTTIIPGISRRVKDSYTGQDVYRIIYCEPGFYRMIGNNFNILVERRDSRYLFGNQGEPVMAMTERIDKWFWKPMSREMTVEPYSKTTVYENRVTEEMLLAILTFPMLRFY